MNRLGSATSPYLRQHADNPVHWQQWGPEVFEEARRRDVPILLSVGYSSCHWCHVMAHESFEDPGIAQIMNELFVSVKVDREERPDLDAVYMNATVAMTGQGGWPMTCFLTPDGEPFYCGTYYPPRPRGGMPSFLQVLEAISDAWISRRDQVSQSAEAVATELRRASGVLPAGQSPLNAAVLDSAVAEILGAEDTVRGGFGGPPKFPPSALLEGMLRDVERTGSHDVLTSIVRTAEAMARGGIFDQLAGGFARYSVDADWVVPHFEKMLYDNALLLRCYAHLARVTDSALAARVAGETADFLLRDLRTSEGGFAAALDADTDGVEGSTYVWTPQELADVLGEDDGAWAAELFSVTPTGTFEAGASVLQLRADPDDLERWKLVCEKLSRARSLRPQPARDDKVVTAWNGLAITALAEASVALGRDDLLDAAAQCADFVLRSHVVDGRLRRASLDDEAGAAVGVLEDHGALATALLTLHQASGETRWLSAATGLLDLALEHFADRDDPGAWFDTADDAEVLLHRPRDPLDGATPSGASLVAEALLTASVLAEPEPAGRYAESAAQTLDRAVVLLERAARSAGHWLTVAEAAVRGPLQVAVAVPATQTPGELTSAARRRAPGGCVVVAGASDSTPLLRDRPVVGEAETAYICRGSVCGLPVTTADELGRSLVG